jgi:hypothetical protein
MVKGIKLVNIPVRDQARALKLYTEKVGFTIATDQAMGPRSVLLLLALTASGCGARDALPFLDGAGTSGSSGTSSLASTGSSTSSSSTSGCTPATLGTDPLGAVDLALDGPDVY